jgi:hypothetical protein
MSVANEFAICPTLQILISSRSKGDLGAAPLLRP